MLEYMINFTDECNPIFPILCEHYSVNMTVKMFLHWEIEASNDTKQTYPMYVGLTISMNTLVS